MLKTAVLLQGQSTETIDTEVLDLIGIHTPNPMYEFTHLVRLERADAQARLRKRRAPLVVVGAAWRECIRALETLLTRRRVNSGATYSISTGITGQIPTTTVRAQVDSITNEITFDQTAITQLKELGIDLLVMHGPWSVSRNCLDSLKLSTLAVRYGPHRLETSQDFGFWEVLAKSPITSFWIEHQRPDASKAAIVRAGHIPTAEFVSQNRLRIVRKSNAFVHLALQELAEPGSSPCEVVAGPYSSTRCAPRSSSAELRYLGHLLLSILRRLRSRAMSRKLQWEVAVGRSSAWDATNLGALPKVPNPAGRYMADPMLVSFRGLTTMYVEDFDIAGSRGSISAYDVSDSCLRFIGKVIQEPFHLSFPFVFEFDSSLYMCPESSQAGDIRLYRCSEYPIKWEFSQVLIPDVQAADTIIFPRNGRWWLLTNIDTARNGDLDSELHIYWADNPLSGHWIRHPKNPVIFDSRRARNGGLVVDGQDVFRVFQSQGMNAYGQSMGISKICDISDSDYREEVMCELAPRFDSDAKGMHTFSFVSGAAAIDLASWKRVSRRRKSLRE